MTFGSSSTGVTVTVGQTLTFTNNTPSFSLVVDPTSLNNVQSQDSGVDRPRPTQPVGTHWPPLIPACPGPLRLFHARVTSGPTTGVATFPSSGWGASATLTTGGTDGATLAAGLTGGKLAGLPDHCS